MASTTPEPEEPPAFPLPKVDWERFVELLDNPPEPNDALKALMAEDGPKGDNRPFTIAE